MIKYSLQFYFTVDIKYDKAISADSEDIKNICEILKIVNNDWKDVYKKPLLISGGYSFIKYL